ncbi:MAG TPA: hypothetical protein VGQ35_12685 [Dongiaceae bacterium]|nr:hypothetical protein [Dongiaceae bacterium]
MLLLQPGTASAGCESGMEASWSTLEQRAWMALVAGDDFDGAAEVAGQGGGQPELSAAFLRNILTCDRLFALLPEGVVSMRNVGVRERLDLSYKSVLARLECRNCVFTSIVAKDSAWLGGVALNGVQVFETLDLSNSRLSSSLILTESDVRDELNLSRAEIAGDVIIADSDIVELIADSASIGGSLELRGVEVLDYATFWGAVVAHDVVLAGSKAGRRTVIGSTVEEVSGLDGNSPPALSFGSAKIDRRISITDTVVNGGLDMDAVRITEDLWLRGCSAVAGPMNLVFARVGQNIDFSSTLLNDVDLTGARIGGELRLGAPIGRLTAPVWKPGARLLLRNVELSSWTDATGNPAPRSGTCVPVNAQADPWPKQVDAIGFSYRNIGGLGGSPATAHGVDWFCRWLERQMPFSFEPYQHAAAYLRGVGLDEDADDVLYCGKIREIDNTASWLGKFLLQMQRGFVGFGYRIERSLIWAAVFIVLGQQIFSRTKEAKAHHMPFGLAYSVEMFIPALSLRHLHQEIDLTGWQRYYFYIHKFMGWVLSSLVVASFVGLLGD